MIRPLTAALLLLIAGCGATDPGNDAGPQDAGPQCPGDRGCGDAGTSPDSGVAGSDAGQDAGRAIDGGQDGGPIDAGLDAGALDGGRPDGGPDAGRPDAGLDGGADAGTVIDAGPIIGSDGGISAIRFGITSGNDGVFSNAPANPNSHTVTGWIRVRVLPALANHQYCACSFENPAPSTAYQLMVSTAGANQWESHDSVQGGFLFAPIDAGWWFIAETHSSSGPTTILYWKKDGAASLSVDTGNAHPAISGITRFLIGTDDATGQNEFLDGDLASVKVWNAILTKAELELEAAHVAPVRSANLYAWYPLQSVATMLTDASGNGHPLTPIVSGGSWTVQAGPAIAP